MRKKNVDILRKMVRYCDEIDVTNTEFGNTLEALKAKSTYKNAVAMCIFQIGELTTHFTEDFRATYTKVPWKDIKNMRNIAAHRYDSFDLGILWETVTDDIPELREYCELIIRQFEVLEQEAIDETK